MNVNLSYKPNQNALQNASIVQSDLLPPPFRNRDINLSRSYAVRSAMNAINDFHYSAYTDQSRVHEIELAKEDYSLVYLYAYLTSNTYFKKHFSDIEGFVLVDEIHHTDCFGFTRELFNEEIQKITFSLKK